MVDLLPGKCGVVVLGIMQDAGLPHIGCTCARCTAVYENRRPADYAAGLAVVDQRDGQTSVWLIDATPDIKFQLNLLAPLLPHPARRQRLRMPDGIFLTHAHLGHIGGLPQLGPEAMDAQQLPVYAPPGLCHLLQNSAVWRPAVKGLILNPLVAGQALHLAPGLTITAWPVPHRDEWQAGTFAYEIRGPRRALLYLPDIDDWDLWKEATARLSGVDIALVDGSFYSTDELHGRTPAAHPLVRDTLTRFAALPTQLFFTHINHTNPILDEDSPERRQVLAAGRKIAYTGLSFSLSTPEITSVER